MLASYLGYLADRAYSPRTVEAYALDLLVFARCLRSEDVTLESVTTDVIIRYLAACRRAPVRGRPGGNVYSIRAGRSPGRPRRRLFAQAYLLAERPETSSAALFVVAKGPDRGAGRGKRWLWHPRLARARRRQRSRLGWAADDLLRWMGRVAEIASNARQRACKLVCV